MATRCGYPAASPYAVSVEFGEIEVLRERHPAWRLLRANNAALVLAFLGSFFVEQNRGPTPAGEVITALDDVLYELNTATSLPPSGDTSLISHNEQRASGPRYPKDARAYLDDWSADDAGFLRRLRPLGHEEIHYEATPALEKAYAWIVSLRARTFVGTESRLHIVVDLLRQIVHGTEVDPGARLAELRRRRDEIDAEIADVEAGRIALMDRSAVRDRYQQFAANARELLADFRQVEENFRALDRAAREKIATWTGAKGQLLAALIGDRSQITDSDEGHSFQAFYDYLLSQSRQEELTALLAAVAAQPDVDAEPRMRRVNYEWAHAAERTQHTVRQISDQLRRFLDDSVWFENRRVLEVVRRIEANVLAVRTDPPPFGLEIDGTGLPITLPTERPLYHAPVAVRVDSSIEEADEVADADLLFQQVFVDRARLAGHIRALVPPRTSAQLTDIVTLFPIEQGAAEIVAYLALAEDDIAIDLDESAESTISYADPNNPDAMVSARLPEVTVKRV